jgi:hypothetical protein
MKEYLKWAPTRIPFAERYGIPTEFEAAIGKIAIEFSFLEDAARHVIVLLSGIQPTAGHIMTAGLSCRQKLDVLSSLSQHQVALFSKMFLADGVPITTIEEEIREVIIAGHRAEELRNVYVHSSYSEEKRVKLSVRSKRGFQVAREDVDPGLLLDVADYITCVAAELEALPMILGIADQVGGSGNTVEYRKQGEIVATFTYGEVG